MPNEVIAQVHHLAIVAEKYDSIVFTNMDGNILSEQFTEDADNENRKHGKYHNQQTTAPKSRGY